MKDKIIKNAEYYIHKIGLEEKEGLEGYIKETTKSDLLLLNDSLPERFTGDRNAYSMNYFLLKEGQKLKLHTLNQDEQWFYHAGGAIRITYFFEEEEDKITIEIGPDLEKGQLFQASIPHNSWFEAEISEGEFCLVSCSLAPGFDPRDSVFQEFKLFNELNNEIL